MIPAVASVDSVILDDWEESVSMAEDSFESFVPTAAWIEAAESWAASEDERSALGNSTYSEKLSRPLALNIWSDGSLVETRRKNTADLLADSFGDFKKTSCGPRGVVNCLSSNSRRRLSATVAKLRRDAPCHFITLTYPGHASNWNPELSAYGPPVPLPGPRESKTDMRLFFKWIRYRYPDFSAVWKLEPQERGVPHFHLLAYGLPDDESVMLSLRDRWFSQVGRCHDMHNAYGFKSDYLGADADKARAYVSKYVSKGDVLRLLPDHGKEADKSPGRFWGLEYQDSLPFSDCIDFEISEEFTAFAIRTLRRLHLSKMRRAFVSRVSKFTSLPVIGLQDLKPIRSIVSGWAVHNRQRWGIFPKFWNPYKKVQVLSNNFTTDPREFINRLLDAVEVMASTHPPDHLAGPRGRLP